jgi:hypothetical protein
MGAPAREGKEITGISSREKGKWRDQNRSRTHPRIAVARSASHVGRQSGSAGRSERSARALAKLVLRHDSHRTIYYLGYTLGRFAGIKHRQLLISYSLFELHHFAAQPTVFTAKQRNSKPSFFHTAVAAGACALLLVAHLCRRRQRFTPNAPSRVVERTGSVLAQRQTPLVA